PLPICSLTRGVKRNILIRLQHHQIGTPERKLRGIMNNDGLGHTRSKKLDKQKKGPDVSPHGESSYFVAVATTRFIEHTKQPALSAFCSVSMNVRCCSPVICPLLSIIVKA